MNRAVDIAARGPMIVVAGANPHLVARAIDASRSTVIIPDHFGDEGLTLAQKRHREQALNHGY